MEEHVRICHFRNHFELTRKNLMVKNLKRLKKQLERESKSEAAKCDFFPMTYELPSEYHIFVEEFKKHPGTVWIMKPIAKSQGKGIFLFRRLKDITEWKKDGYRNSNDERREETKDVETYIVQRYLSNPYLIGGRKFDLRIYVLVTSVDPLRIWVHKDGFLRFCTHKYAEPTNQNIQDLCMHLTNYAINKNSKHFVHNNDNN
jgi:tubulin polyglutamylase TTLL9